MKRNSDLIRLMLLRYEGDQEAADACARFSEEERIYHGHLLVEGGFANGTVVRNEHGQPSGVSVSGLTLKGHELLDSIRDGAASPQEARVHLLGQPWARSEIEESMLRRSRDMAACTGHFLDTIGNLRARGQRDVETIWNAACHVNIVDHDISVSLYFHTTTDDVWALRSASRALATLLYEGIDDLSELFGKAFIDACKSAGVYQEIETEYRATKKKLSEFSRQHHSFLKGIRVNAGAHKDHDAVRFIEAVIHADTDKMIALGCEFSDIMVTMGRFAQGVIEKVNVAYRKKGLIP